MNRTITSPVFALMLLFSAAASHAGPIGITLATAPLAGNPGAPFSLDFQFTDGSGTNDGNNTLTLTNFNFGGGSAGRSRTEVDGGSALRRLRTVGTVDLYVTYA